MPALFQKAIQMRQQLQYFEEYKAKLEKEIGSKQAQQQIKEAVFYINAGSEDFALNYFQDGNGLPSIPLPEYERLLLNLTQQFIQVCVRATPTVLENITSTTTYRIVYI